MLRNNGEKKITSLPMTKYFNCHNDNNYYYIIKIKRHIYINLSTLSQYPISYLNHSDRT